MIPCLILSWDDYCKVLEKHRIIPYYFLVQQICASWCVYSEYLSTEVFWEEPLQLSAVLLNPEELDLLKPASRFLGLAMNERMWVPMGIVPSITEIFNRGYVKTFGLFPPCEVPVLNFTLIQLCPYFHEFL